MKDFSIQSILAHTIAINDRCAKCQPPKNGGSCETTNSEVSATEMNLTKRKNYLCTTRFSKNDVEIGKYESGVSFRNSGIDKEQFLIDPLIFEYSQQNDKSSNKVFSAHVVQEKIDLNKPDDVNINEEIVGPSRTGSNRFFFTEFNTDCRGVNINRPNERQRRISATNCSNENSDSGLSEVQCGRLTVEGKSSCSLSNNPKMNEDETSKWDTEKLQRLRSKLEWLDCTRYKPPKVPRKSRTDKHKRSASLHPRIPFSMHQLDVLEQKFCNGTYLSKNDVFELSAALKLPPKKVKIWFQNRRAKERRDSRS